MPDHHHRSGSLRQSNKKNKRSKSSKRSLSRAAGGKVAETSSNRHGKSSSLSASLMQQQSKANRRNQQNQRRQSKREELMRKKRGITSTAVGSLTTASSSALSLSPLPPPPRVIGIVSLGSNDDIEEQVRECLLTGADKAVRSSQEAEDGSSNANTLTSTSSVVSCKFDVHKKQGHLTLLTCTSSTLPNYNTLKEDDKDSAVVLAALDLARVCDVMLFVIDGSEDASSSNSRLPGEGITDMIHIEERSASAKSANTAVGPDFDHLISERGDKVLAALKGQGLPTPLTILAKRAEKDPLLSNTNCSNNNSNDNEDDMDDQMTVQTASFKSVRRTRVKRQLELKNYVSRFATTEFGTGQDRMVELDLTTTKTGTTDIDNDNNTMDDDHKTFSSSSATAAGSSSALVRTLCTMSCRPPKWVSASPRSYLIADSSRYNSMTQELYLTGFVRGMAPFNVNALLHVPNLGTFAAKSVSRGGSIVPPLSRHFSSSNTKRNTVEGSMTDVLWADPDRQESLDMFASPNALEGEQNLVGFDEDDNNSMENYDPGNDAEEKPVSRPAGWSDYQSAWLDAVDQEVNEGDENEDEAEKDRGELAQELNQRKSKPTADTVAVAVAVAAAARGDATLGTAMDMDLDEANDVTTEEKRSLMDQRRKEQRENQEFPDEVQVGEDQKASDRFARYRSLKSFRKSHWDPKENLPESYASIYHFPRFKLTQRSVLNERKELIRSAEQAGAFWGCTPSASDGDNKEEDAPMEGDDDDSNNNESSNEDDDVLFGCIPSGSYVTLTLRNVPAAPAPGALVTAVSLLPHENKVSVLHMAVSRQYHCSNHDDDHHHPQEGTSSSSSLLVKSKDVVTFRCGWRTWQGRPVFSQLNLNCDKHPLERFLPVFGAASVFGPVTFGPTSTPVLCFVNNQIVAMGTVLGADADRLILKRIILTGYPVKVQKRHAVVKYMFNNPDDVKWFQPAGLYTKHGLQGNIVSSVGEHGTMKCLFHAPIKQHDTVCLPLYKRLYPKYVENTNNDSNQSTKNGRYHLIVR